jgi:AraC-like DNA-binding protein
VNYVARPPSPPLAKYVDYLWASRGAPAHARECVVPTGTVELLVSLVEDKGRIYDTDGRGRWVSGAAVSGVYHRPFSFDITDKASAVGVHFKPGYAGALLGVPPGELVDCHVDLDLLWGRRARELRERLCAAATTDERFTILEAELLSRLGGATVQPAVAYAVAVLARPEARVGDIAKRAGLSQRRLIELFTPAVGMTPKRFGRVLRFQRAIGLARRAALDWTRIAQDCGYYDQAHLIRDFHDLADLTPSDLLRASAHPKEHHQLAMLER